jgi:hypothetical protein
MRPLFHLRNFVQKFHQALSSQSYKICLEGHPAFPPIINGPSHMYTPAIAILLHQLHVFTVQLQTRKSASGYLSDFSPAHYLPPCLLHSLETHPPTHNTIWIGTVARCIFWLKPSVPGFEPEPALNWTVDSLIMYDYMGNSKQLWDLCFPLRIVLS